MRIKTAVLVGAAAGMLGLVLAAAPPSRAASGVVVITMQPGRAWAVTHTPDSVAVARTVETCITISVRTYLRRYAVLLAYESSEKVDVSAAPAGSADCAYTAPMVGLTPGGQTVLWRGLNGSTQLFVRLRVRHSGSGSAVVVPKPAVVDL